MFKKETQTSQAAILMVPDTLTPPILVEKVAGAPPAWELRKRVAESLRNRDIPAGLNMRGRIVYRLKGKVLQLVRRGNKTQVTVKWHLYNTNGKKVGEVTQLAAIPTKFTISGKASPGGDDITQAMADAAAESLAPIVPSSRLRTTQQAMTGLPAPKTRKSAEAKNRSTAIGKADKKPGRLSQNLLRTPTAKNAGAGANRTVTGGAATTNTKARTALGRTGGKGGTLSRNLLRPGKATRKGFAPDSAKPTSTAPNGTAGRNGGATAGSMEKLIQRYPTRVERKRTAKARTPRAVLTRTAAKKPKRRNVLARRPVTQASRVPVTTRPAGRPAAKRTVARRTYWVQVGSYRSRNMAASSWQATRRAGGDSLQRVHQRIMRANIKSKGIYYRVQVGPYAARTKATSLCRTLKARSIDCFLYREVAERRVPRARKSVRRTRAQTRTTVTTSRKSDVPSKRIRPTAAHRRNARKDTAPVSTRPGFER